METRPPQAPLSPGPPCLADKTITAHVARALPQGCTRTSGENRKPEEKAQTFAGGVKDGFQFALAPELGVSSLDRARWGCIPPVL